MKSDFSWFSEYPKYTFNEYSRHLRKIYGEVVYRVSIDAGFSCPNREQSLDHKGCIYCEETGSRAPYLGKEGDLRSQINSSVDFLEARYGARKYILYFQAFSNTFASPDRLKKIYDEGLSSAPFLELVVSTRPDCIDEEKADLLYSYTTRGLKVWVELGLQSASSRTLTRIKRGHSLADFGKAYRIVKDRAINVAIHVIFGLPGEGSPEIMQTMQFLARLRPDGIKIHNLHIPKGTALADEYEAGEIVPPGAERHLEYVIRALEMLPQDTLILRLTCDTRPYALISPRNFGDKAGFYSLLRNEMRTRNTWQGKKYDPKQFY